VEDMLVWGFKDEGNDHAWCTTRKPCNGWGMGSYVLWCFFYYTVVVSLCQIHTDTDTAMLCLNVCWRWR